MATALALIREPPPASSASFRSRLSISALQAATRAAAGADASLAIVAKINHGSTFDGSSPARTFALN
jgi:hypothetical protein